MCESPHNDPHSLYSRARCHGSRCINSSRWGCIFPSKARHTQVTFVTTPYKIWLTPPLSFECLRWNMNECVHWRLELFRYEYVKYFLRVVALQLCISPFNPPSLSPSLPASPLSNLMRRKFRFRSPFLDKQGGEWEREKTLWRIKIWMRANLHTHTHTTLHRLTAWTNSSILLLTNRQADI